MSFIIVRNYNSVFYSSTEVECSLDIAHSILAIISLAKAPNLFSYFSLWEQNAI